MAQKRINHERRRQVEDILKKFDIQYEKGDFMCEACICGKQIRSPFVETGTKTSHFGEIIHSDVCRHMEKPFIRWEEVLCAI